MSTHEVGRRFEDVAAGYLLKQGWRILARNVRDGRKEIDLVICRGSVLAFVEVKGRRSTRFGHPLDSITWRKRSEIARVARAWLRGHPPPAGTVLRFDAVAVTVEGAGTPRVEHVEDAWRL